MTFNIIDIIKTPNAILHELGLKVYETVKPFLSEGKNIGLSFSGLRNVNSLFCNASIGKLFLDFPDSAEKLLKCEDVTSEFWLESIYEAIELAKSPAKAEARNNAIKQLFH